MTDLQTIVEGIEMKEDVRVPLAPGSCPTGQAAPRLDAPRFDPSRYEIGQRLWYVDRRRNRASGYWVTVTKVGRKWATLQTEQGYDAGRVEIGSVRLDGGNYTSPGSLYASEDAYEAQAALNRAWHDFRGAVILSHARPPHIDGARLKALFALFRDSDGSGEASETRSGSTVGDSADPKGIAKDSRP